MEEPSVALTQSIGVRRVKRSSETVSFRIDSKVKLILEDEARKKNINLNTLVSQIFSAYAFWGRYAEELGLLPLNKDILREIFNAISREEIENIAQKMGETVAHEEIVFLFNEVNPETVRQYIELRSSHFSAYHHWYENGMHHFTLQHDLGTNYSLFLKGYLLSMLRNTLGKGMESSDISPNSLTFSITN